MRLRLALITADVVLVLDGHEDRRQGIETIILNVGRIAVVHAVVILGIHVGVAHV